MLTYRYTLNEILCRSHFEHSVKHHRRKLIPIIFRSSTPGLPASKPMLSLLLNIFWSLLAQKQFPKNSSGFLLSRWTIPFFAWSQNTQNLPPQLYCCNRQHRIFNNCSKMHWRYACWLPGHQKSSRRGMVNCAGDHLWRSTFENRCKNNCRIGIEGSLERKPVCSLAISVGTAHEKSAPASTTVLVQLIVISPFAVNDSVFGTPVVHDWLTNKTKWRHGSESGNRKQGKATKWDIFGRLSCLHRKVMTDIVLSARHGNLKLNRNRWWWLIIKSENKSKTLLHLQLRNAYCQLAKRLELFCRGKTRQALFILCECVHSKQWEVKQASNDHFLNLKCMLIHRRCYCRFIQNSWELCNKFSCF